LDRGSKSHSPCSQKLEIVVTEKLTFREVQTNFLDSRFFGNLDYFPVVPDPGSMRQRQDRTADHFRYADSQGTSTVVCGDDLKSKLGSLPAQPIFGTPDSVSFSLVEDILAVGLLCTQQVEEDASEFVGCGSDRLGFAQLACDAPKELTQIVLRMMQGLSAHAQGGRYAASNTAALGEQHLTAGVKSSEDTIAKSLEGDYRPEHLFALRQSLEAFRYYQQLVLEADREIQLQLAELKTAATAQPTTLIFFSGQSPSQDAKADAFRNRETSVPISHRMV
jgi:hypothetical protein